MPRVKKNVPSRKWCFTINNYTLEDIVSLVAFQLHPGFRYLIAGFEVGKKDTKHIQGFCYLENKVRRKTMVKWFPTAHLEQAGGDIWENYVYCSKGGDFVEQGEYPQQGQASWRSIEACMKAPERHMALYTQYRKSYREVLSSRVVAKQRQLYLVKDDSVLELLKTGDVSNVFINPTTLDLDGYTNESTCVLNSEWVDEHGMRSIILWKRGFPPKLKFGYEFLRFDPDIVYIKVENQKFRNIFRTNYMEFWEEKFSPVDIDQLLCLESSVEEESESIAEVVS